MGYYILPPNNGISSRNSENKAYLVKIDLNIFCGYLPHAPKWTPPRYDVPTEPAQVGLPLTQFPLSTTEDSYWPLFVRGVGL